MRPIRHPVPTPATLKELYANAYFCAFPACKTTLYKVDLENQVRTLNSTAAHICARSEGGPRWNPNQSAEENMSVSNLLVLCREHSAEIDDEKKVSLFAPDILREWKRSQLAAYDALGQGWNIREQDVKQVQNHFVNFDNTLTGSVIELGGSGGSAPGAGGGGGGVFGSSNSVGGKGGNGGNVINLSGKPGTAPGSGGGACGVLGDGAVAGEGGSGGELIQGMISGLQAGQVLHIEVGKGGVDGKDGGESSISLVGENGELTPLLVAKGGKTGKPGRHGDLSGFARAITDADLSNGARVTTLILAEFVKVKGDLVTILDGCWGSFSVPSLPFKMAWPVYAVLHMNKLSVPTVIGCLIRIKDPNNIIILEKNVLFEKLDERVVRAQLGILLEFDANEFGVWNVELISGELILGTVPIHVLAIPAD